jgi:MSHA biogenesis protein MshQ
MKIHWLSCCWPQIVSKLQKHWKRRRSAERLLRRNRRRSTKSMVPTEPLECRMLLTTPAVTSIVDVLASTTNQSVIPWTVTFNQAVTGVDPTDFFLVKTGTVSANLLQVTGSGTTYAVTASGVTGNGTLGLNLVDNDSIVGAGVALGGAGTGNGNFTGQVETLDTIFPSVASIAAAGGSGSTLNFTATFSEAVTGVTASAFAKTGSTTNQVRGLQTRVYPISANLARCRA